MGSAADYPIRLPERFDPHVTDIIVAGETVYILPDSGSTLILNEEGALTEKCSLAADTTGNPDFIFLDDLRFMLIIRDGNYGIRIWDPRSPVRSNFPGRIWFEGNLQWRMLAQLHPYEVAKQVVIEDIRGFQHEAQMDAALEFEFAGQNYRLDGQRLESGAYYLIFKDQTAGTETYPAGRYIVTEQAQADTVVIDFNRAYNPPCAFTDFATCPLPRPENILPIRINAGEKFPNLS